MAANHQGRPMLSFPGGDAHNIARLARLNRNLSLEIDEALHDVPLSLVHQQKQPQSLHRSQSLDVIKKARFSPTACKNKQWEEDREKLGAAIKRLSLDMKKLTEKLAYMKNANGWIGLDKKKNRKKMIEEMKLMIASKKKELEQKKLALFRLRSDEVLVKEKKQNVLQQICTKQDSFLQFIRRNKEKQMGLDKYYYAENTKNPEEWEKLTASCGHVDTQNDQTKEVCWNEVILKENGRLGGGSFGEVSEGFVPSIGKVAVKILRPSSMQVISFRRELNALRRTADCPLIVKLKGFCVRPHYALFTELCEGGSLDTVLKQIKLSERAAVHIALQVAEAMNHLLSMTPPIFHRDLSTANVFLRRQSDYRSVCLGDFGIAVDVASGEVYPTDPSVKSKNGNPRYRAPEVTLTGHYHAKSDVYSFGNLFFELLTSCIPFPLVEAKDVAQHIAQGHIPKFPKHCRVEKAIKGLVHKCWRRNPANRPSFGDIMPPSEDGRPSKRATLSEKKKKNTQQNGFV